MATMFEYRARRATGEVVTGAQSAPDRSALSASLAESGLMLLDARRARGAGGRGRAGRVRLPALLAFVRELRHLVAAGLPVAQVLKLLEGRRDDPTLAAAVRGLREGVERGRPLDEAAADYPGAFDRLFCATLRAGAKTGRLPDALGRLESFLLLRATLRSRIRKAMSYPVFLLILLVVVLAGLMLFVLPRFAELYAEFGSELPAATRLLMSAVEAAPVALPVGAAIIFVAAIGFGRLMRRRGARRRVDGMLLRLPLLGPVQRDIELVQVSYVMAMLLAAGTPLRQALDFVIDSARNTAVRDALSHAVEEVARGRSLSDALAPSRLYPDTSLSMIRAGELAGGLAAMFEAISQMHEAQLEDRMARLLALIEPVMMLLVGVVLGAVIITVYLPVFGMSGVVQ